MVLRPAWMSILFVTTLLGSGAVLPQSGWAQTPLDLEEARRQVERRGTGFWEQAWIQHLRTQAGDDGSIDWAYDDRQQLNAFSHRYRQAVEEAGGLWRNQPVQDYVNRRLLSVQPNRMMPGRPGTFAVQILRTSVPNALAFSDGTIYLTTGLLATLDRPAELEAILAHEVAHIVLDHALANYQSGEHWDRARNLLSRVASGVTSIMTPLGGGDASTGSPEYGLERGLSNQYLNPELLGPAGLDHGEDQEAAANRLAREWLRTEDRPSTVLHAALSALRRASLVDRPAPGATFADLHPVPEDLRPTLLAATETKERTASSGASDRSYDRQMGALLEQEAELEISNRRYRSALDALDRTIEAGRPSPTAYLLKAHALRNTTVDAADYDQILSLLDTADTLSDDPMPRIDAERALIRLRQDRIDDARRLLRRCVETIDSLRRNASGEAARATEAMAEEPSAEETALYESLRTWAVDLLVRLESPSPTEGGDGDR